MLEIIIAVLFAGMVLVLLAMMGYAAYIIYTDVREYEREKKNNASEAIRERERAEKAYACERKTEARTAHAGDEVLSNGVFYIAVSGTSCDGCAGLFDSDLCADLPDCVRHDVIFKCVEE